MTQEVQITVTLEVDVTLQKADIEDFVTKKLSGKLFDLIRIDSVKEESEIYDVEDENKFETKVNLYLPDEMLLGKKIVDFEVAPLIKVGAGIFEKADETDLSEESPAHYWSVYVRVDAGEENFNPVDCIADFPTKEEAVKFEDILRKLFLKR